MTAEAREKGGEKERKGQQGRREAGRDAAGRNRSMSRLHGRTRIESTARSGETGRKRLEARGEQRGGREREREEEDGDSLALAGYSPRWG